MSQRKKSRNFTEREKLHLIAIVDKHKHIVENKATDGTTIKAKLVAWQSIAEEYNMNCESEIRVATQLKSLYKNIKAKIRKDVAGDNGKQNQILKIEKVISNRDIGIQVDLMNQEDVITTKSPAVSLAPSVDGFSCGLDVACVSPTSSAVHSKRNRRQFCTVYNTKRSYFERKLQLVNFQLKSARIQHSMDMKIKRATLKKLSLDT